MLELPTDHLEELRLFNSNHEEQINSVNSLIKSENSSLKYAIELVRLVLEDDGKGLLEVNKVLAVGFMDTVKKFLEIIGGERSRLMVKSFDPTNEINKEKEQWRLEFSAILISGIISAALTGRIDDRRIFDGIIQIGLTPDGPALLLRRALTSRLDLWDPRNPQNGIPDLIEKFNPKDNCILRLRNSSLGLGRNLLLAYNGIIVDANADGITGLSPNTGLASDMIVIEGHFSASRPGNIAVGFHGNHGIRHSSIVNWSEKRIEVIVPESFDEGPVGFLVYGDGVLNANPTTPMEFGSILTECVGASAAKIVGKLELIPPVKSIALPQTIPTIAGGQNIFYASPVLDSIVPDISYEGNPNPVVVTGRRLQPTDQVEVGGILCPTTYISQTRLNFKINNVPTGRRSVRIKRGSRFSNEITMNIRATLSPNQGGRVKQPTWVSLTGSGFAKGEIYAVLRNGSITVRLTEDVKSLHDLNIYISRPNPPPAPDRRGEKIKVDIFDQFGIIRTVEFTLHTCRIVSFGDSIVWGQGLNESAKFTTLVANYLRQQFGGSMGVYIEDRLAHSGAEIMKNDPSIDPVPDAENPPIGVFEGELPNSFPSIANQIEAWALTQKLKDEAKEVDVVILDGGINDVSVSYMLDPTQIDDAALVQKTLDACDMGMKKLLTLVTGRFPNAKVIVTGYYPIVSNETDLNDLFLLVIGLGVLATSGLTATLLGSGGLLAPIVGTILTGLAIYVKSQLVHRSALFASTANSALSSAVASASAGSNVKLAVPQFNSKNSIFAPDSFLFGVNVGLGTLNPVDPVASKRLQLAGCSTSLICTIASIGHPNERGALAYFEAIKNFL